ncbi:MAG: hypothetical protein O3B01_00130 [Planctomycetota bacterium]|nr:hypothetical protein [Planctomycetota bacterium]MDA1136961.1 hypothetical protein [Planctomycetota bacterium]
MPSQHEKQFVHAILSEVAHDLKNPLNVLGMKVSMLRRSLAKEEDDYEEEFSSILRQLERMNEILSGYVERSAPKVRAGPENFDRMISEIVNEFVEDVKVGVECDGAHIGSVTLDRQHTTLAVKSFLQWLACLPDGKGPISLTAERSSKLRISMSRKGAHFTSDILHPLSKASQSFLPMLARNLISRQGGRVAIESGDSRSILVIEMLMETVALGRTVG